MRHFLVMGVSGCGKSTLARRLSGRLDATFVEADDHHAPEAVAKMRSGRPLTDSDRWDWLDRVAGAADAAPGLSVIACSALKESYRTRLCTTLSAMAIIHLHASRPVLARRIGARKDHFMPASLLDSQLAELEPPTGALTLSLDVSLTPEELENHALRFAGSLLSRG